MVLWWIGNLVFLFVIIPVVVLLLHGLLKPVIEIGKYADDILEHLGNGVNQLGAISDLGQTRQAAGQVSSDLQRYGNALSRVL